MENVIEKTANDEYKQKVINTAIGSAAIAATIGAIIRSNRSKKRNEKLRETEKTKNAIVIPIKKTKFMEGLPTPKDLAASRGETEPKQVGMKNEDVKALPSPNNENVTVSAPTVESTKSATNMTQEEIAAKKKEILRTNARKFNFFGKSAAEDGEKSVTDDKLDTDTTVSKEEPIKNTDEEDKKKSPEDDNENGEKRVYLRDQEGRFVSPTDPVGVAVEEKSAGVLDFITTPVRNAWNAATDKPVWLTAGALGSLFIASKISEAINERRRIKSKERLEEDRNKYVDLLNKNAEDKPNDEGFGSGVGKVLGTAFFLPMAFSALITNRIIENRKIEKKRQKEKSDSYPDDPIIMYKTSEDNEFQISPKTALALMIIKEAMFEDIARDEIMQKEAQDIKPDYEDMSGKNESEVNVWRDWNSANMNSATDDFVSHLLKPENNDKLYNLVTSYGPNGTDEQRQKAIADMKNMSFGDSFSNWVKGNDKFFDKPEFKSNLLKNKRLYNALAERFNNDPMYIRYRDKMIDDRLAQTFQRGSILHNIISWLVKNLGIGSYMFNKNLSERMNNLSGAISESSQEQRPIRAGKGTLIRTR